MFLYHTCLSRWQKGISELQSLHTLPLVDVRSVLVHVTHCNWAAILSRTLQPSHEKIRFQSQETILAELRPK